MSCRELKSCGYRIKVMCDDAELGGLGGLLVTFLSVDCADPSTFPYL